MLGVSVLSLLLSVCAALPSSGRLRLPSPHHLPASALRPSPEGVPRDPEPDHYWGEDDCGYSMHDDAGREPFADTHIVNGWEAREHEFPYQTSLKNFGSHYCGGNIINTNTILTAAHCIEGSSVSVVSVGEHDLSNPDDHSEFFDVSSSVVHEDYNDNSLENDIAILKLAGTIHFDDAAQPICPPSKNRDGYADLTTTVSGWGYDGNEYPDILQAVNVPVWTYERCQNLMPGNIVDGMICAADNDQGRDSCYGDSGGPLAWKNDDGRFELVGLVSWGYDCGDPVYPGVYTDVEFYEEWIDNNM